MAVYDERRCELGEGIFWHPERGQLFWFDITGGRLLSRDGDRASQWEFGEMASAAGWVDRDHLLVASETALWLMRIADGSREIVTPFAADAPNLRSNDGRADPWGGFWISTMSKKSEDRAGGIWRLWRGELREIFPGLSIPNAICFDAERELAYFSDTRVGAIWAQPLDPATGWPRGERRVFAQLGGATGFNPDGAVVDADGNLWNAQWGSGRVACYAPDGRFLGAERFDAARLSCPAFGGDDLRTLHVTSAQQGMSAEARREEPFAGMTFARRLETARGRPEPAVILG